MPQYGTSNTLDTLAASQQSIAQYGEDRAFEAIDASVRAHNEIMSDMIADFIERPTVSAATAGRTRWS
jgi:hypothetical protein